MAISKIQAGQEIDFQAAVSRADVAHSAKHGDDLLVSLKNGDVTTPKRLHRLASDTVMLPIWA